MQFNLPLKCAIFDGAFEPKKSTTRIERRSARVKTILHITNTLKNFDGKEVVTSASAVSEINGRSDPMTISLYRDILISCLRENSIEVIVSSGEADKLLALTCKETENTAVLTVDSDFFIFGVPVALLSSLNYSPAYPPQFAPVDLEVSSQLEIQLFSPSNVMDCLKIPPKYLPHLAVVCGNDFIDAKLALTFAKSKHLSGSLSRVTCVLNLIRSSGSPEIDLKNIFRVAKSAKMYDEALKITTAAYALNRFEDDNTAEDDQATISIKDLVARLDTCPLPERTKRSNIGIELWDLHRTAIIPPSVLGLLKDQRFWLHLAPDSYNGREGGDIENKFFDIRCAFYFALFSTVPTALIDKDEKIIFKEVNRYEGTAYELDMKEKSDVTISSQNGSIDDLSLLLCFSEETKDALHNFPENATVSHKAWATILAILHRLDLLPSSLVRPLLTQFAVIQKDGWLDSMARIAPILPSTSVLLTASAIGLALFWLKMLNALVGSPLGKIDSSLRLFDGFVFTLIAAGKLDLKDDLVNDPNIRILEETLTSLGVAPKK